MPIWFIERNANLVDTYPGLILPMAAMSLPFAILLFRAYFQDFEPDIEDAARIDGCSRFGTFWRVALPMARGPIAAVAVLVMIGAWNDFLTVLVLAESDSMRTMTVGLWGFVGIYRTPYHIILAGLTIATIPILIAYLLFQNQITRSFTFGTTGGR
jgi:ABC-type glycerol-3-phosphate transport system permease component